MENEEGVQDNWNYWVEHYNDPELRASSTAEQEEPTISEVLSREKLRKTLLLIENVPSSCTEEELKNFIEGEIGKASIMRTVLWKNACQATVEFYRASVAERALERFNGQKFRNCYLEICFSEDSVPQAQQKYSSSIQKDTKESKEAETNSFCQKQILPQGPVKSRIPELIPKQSGWNTETATRSGRKNSFSNIQTSNDYFCIKPAVIQDEADVISSEVNDDSVDTGLSLNEFEKELVSLVRKFNHLQYDDGRIQKLLEDKASRPVQEMHRMWPLAFFRNRSDLQLIGPLLCLPEASAAVSRRCSLMNHRNPWKEQWEPLAPSQIDTSTDLAKYLRSFLEHFGPMWIWDRIFLLFVNSLPKIWMKNQKRLVEQVQPHMLDLLCIEDTLFLLGNKKHERAAEQKITKG